MKKIMMMVVGLVVGACLLAGCATAPPLPTKTGKPDVTIQASKAAVFDTITDELLTEGYMLRNVNETKDIAIYFIHHPKMQVIWEEMPVDERVTVNFVQTSTGVRMLGSIVYIAYPGTDRERVVHGPGFAGTDQAGRDNQKLYNVFLKVQHNIEKK
jgi:hypothetical protein